MPPRKDDNGRIDFTLWGISDMELLGIVDDLADEDGWTANVDVRVQLGENVENKERSGVGPRLAWMRRYGWLEQHPDHHNMHRLSAVGQALLDNPKLGTQFERTLVGLNPAQRLALTRELSEMAGAGATEFRTALRRQWTRGLGR